MRSPRRLGRSTGNSGAAERSASSGGCLAEQPGHWMEGPRKSVPGATSMSGGWTPSTPGRGWSRFSCSPSRCGLAGRVGLGRFGQRSRGAADRANISRGSATTSIRPRWAPSPRSPRPRKPGRWWGVSTAVSRRSPGLAAPRGEPAERYEAPAPAPPPDWDVGGLPERIRAWTTLDANSSRCVPRSWRDIALAAPPTSCSEA